MEVKSSLLEGILVLSPVGNIDSGNFIEFEAKVNQEVSADTKFLIFDLNDLTYISSAGLRVFLSIQKMLYQKGGQAVIARPPEFARQVFVVTGFHNLFNIIGDLSAAVRFLKELNA
jgi:anti-sigma B factor antagonist